jgi:hypothetical protein
MGSGITRFKKTEVARIVEGVKKSGALGTFEFQLSTGIVRFHMTGEVASESASYLDAKPNVWDEVLPNGKAKPALTLLKKVP